MKKARRTPAATPEDRALWDAVTKTVKPLRQRPATAPAGEPPATDDRRGVPVPPVARTAPAKPAALRLAPLERRTRARLGKGAIAIDGRVDLHGLTQAMAHRRLGNFLRESQASGAKYVLVITGKGRQGDAPLGDERGILRRSVPNWLAAADLKPYVVGFEVAGRAHGGDGALYVRIRSPLRRKP
jgi:DNA-nicking Smr family endonuclease